MLPWRSGTAHVSLGSTALDRCSVAVALGAGVLCSPTTAVAAARIAPFAASEAAVTAATVPFTWRAGCPVAPSSLRLLHLSYVGFDGRAHQGTMIVNVRVAAEVVKVFSILYARRFPNLLDGA